MELRQILTHDALQNEVFTQVINLDRSKDRLAATATILDGVDLPWTRFSAIAPTQEQALDCPIYNQQRANYLFGRDLLKGEIGCFLSHLGALEAFEKSGRPVGLVLEDDVVLDGDSLEVILATLSFFARWDGSWDCINLTKGQKLRRRVVGQVRGRTLYRAYHFPLLTSGLLWSRTSARKYIEWVNDVGIYAPADNQLRDWLCRGARGFSFDVPPVGLRPEQSVIQDDLPLQHATKPRVNKFSRTELRQKLPLYYHSCRRWLMQD